jgi:hypothetical protein
LKRGNSDVYGGSLGRKRIIKSKRAARKVAVKKILRTHAEARFSDCLSLHPQQRIKFSEAIYVGTIVTGASVSRSKIQSGLPWNFKGVSGKAKNGRRYHCVGL